MSRGAAFDSHVHLTDARFDADRGAVLDRARAVGVERMLAVATDPSDARDAVALARREPGIWASAGLHPHEARRFSAGTVDELERLAGAAQVVAIGETGLDYHYDHSPRARQIESFRAQMELAAKVGLPVIVHSRAADEDTASAIEEQAGRVKGVLHCFTGGERLLETALAADWYVSFSGIVTFKGQDEIAARVRRTPDQRLLIETDAPYLAPAPKRGRRNEPALLVHTCARVAELRGAVPAEIAALTGENALALYGLTDSPVSTS
ncbi:MAG: TatD family hydrolase [Gemmatimonadota bacterium]